MKLARSLTRARSQCARAGSRRLPLRSHMQARSPKHMRAINSSMSPTAVRVYLGNFRYRRGSAVTVDESYETQIEERQHGSPTRARTTHPTKHHGAPPRGSRMVKEMGHQGE